MGGQVIVSMNPTEARKITYKFLRLPHYIKTKIALELKLITKEEVKTFNAPKYKDIFRKAIEEKKLDKLVKAIENGN